MWGLKFAWGVLEWGGWPLEGRLGVDLFQFEGGGVVEGGLN